MWALYLIAFNPSNSITWPNLQPNNWLQLATATRRGLCWQAVDEHKWVMEVIQVYGYKGSGNGWRLLLKECLCDSKSNIIAVMYCCWKLVPSHWKLRIKAISCNSYWMFYHLIAYPIVDLTVLSRRDLTGHHFNSEYEYTNVIILFYLVKSL